MKREDVVAGATVIELCLLAITFYLFTQFMY